MRAEQAPHLEETYPYPDLVLLLKVSQLLFLCVQLLYKLLHNLHAAHSLLRADSGQTCMHFATPYHLQLSI